LPAGLWDALLQDTAITAKAREQYRGATILRLRNVTDHNSTNVHSPSALEADHRGTPTCGYELEVGHVYDAFVESRTLVAHGADQFAPAPDFENLNDADRLRVSQSVFPFTGNYRDLSIWLQ